MTARTRISPATIERRRATAAIEEVLAGIIQKSVAR